MSRPISHQPFSPEELEEMRAQVAAPEENRGGVNGHALNLMGRFLATHDVLAERNERVWDLFARIVKSIEYYADDGMLLRLLEEYHGLKEELRG